MKNANRRKLKRMRAGLLPAACDNSDVAKLHKELKELLSSAKTLPEEIDAQACNKVRRNIDRLLSRAAEVGGPSAHETTATLLELRECLTDSWQKALIYQEEAQRVLENDIVDR